jgi:hypothetical protein
MLKKYSNNYLVISLILLGSLFRIIIFWVSPANNSYDDHLEVIKIYSENFNRPTPFQCWECYQPPLYYLIGALVYNISKFFSINTEISWKIVQFINPFLSIISIILAYQILKLLKIKRIIIAIIISFVITLPRDIFTSAMIGNDYMLVFFTVLSFYLFLKTSIVLDKGKVFWKWISFLIIVVILGSLSKQHGLLLFLFPVIIFIVLLRKEYQKKLFVFVPILIISLIISLSEEFWKFSKTGKFLVSNQHYFDYAKNQFPGTLEKVEFFNFRIFELFQYPFITKHTSASFFTELFARTFYDYEWRFISPKNPFAFTLGGIAYTVGLLWFLYLFIILKKSKKIILQKIRTDWNKFLILVTPFFLGFLFTLVPLLQTLRFPYFSSMKSMFMLPGIFILIISIGRILRDVTLVIHFGKIMIMLNIIYGLLLITYISIFMQTSLKYLHGPLWSLP